MRGETRRQRCALSKIRRNGAIAPPEEALAIEVTPANVDGGRYFVLTANSPDVVFDQKPPASFEGSGDQPASLD